MTNSQFKKFYAEQHNKAYEESKKQKPPKKTKANRRRSCHSRVMLIAALAMAQEVVIKC